MADIFISYAREDLEAASRLASRLEECGWSVFWDRRIPTGRNFHEVIAAELAAARAVIVLWSKHGVASSWVYEEAAKGRDRGILAPVLIDATCQIPMGFGLVQCAELAAWTGDPADTGFRQLVHDLRTLIGGNRDDADVPAPEPSPQPSPRPSARRAPWLAAAAIMAIAVIAVVVVSNFDDQPATVAPDREQVQPLALTPAAVDPSPNVMQPSNTSAVPGRYPQASLRLLTADELAPLGAKELRLMRNEIYARRGYIFQGADLRAYFSQQAWYRPVSSDVEAHLSDVERANVQLIRNFEKPRAETR